MYNTFADWYDAMMRTADYDAWAEYLGSLLREHNCGSVFECGCGTGNISVRLAKKGFKLTASDISEDMLMVARNKMLRAGLRFPVICQDMRELETHKPVDAVVSVCDGVNYLESPDAFFAAAYRALKPGGVLLFDISSAYKLSETLKKTSFSDVDEDWAYICDCEYEKETSRLHMYLTCFVKDGTRYKRFEEHHIQYAYGNEQIMDKLRAAHFDPVGCYACMTRNAPEEDSERIQFVAVKPAEK